jgi:hypothetical protein
MDPELHALPKNSSGINGEEEPRPTGTDSFQNIKSLKASKHRRFIAMSDSEVPCYAIFAKEMPYNSC